MPDKDSFDNEANIEDFTQYQEEQQPTIEIAYQPEFYKIPKKFGTVPVEKEPIGYDQKRGYTEKFPFIDLPIQRLEEISFGYPDVQPKNKLYWGDNLHIMRTLPSDSIDLIYIDPPFFSGRQYNVVFGDQNEIRSFDDIWDGGMPTYLTWLNARLLEMKRLLKRTGSIFVHLDWHASHYVKVEMDKIFGYENLVNEIIWSYRTGGASKERFGRKHDVILYYSKTEEKTFHPKKEKSYMMHEYGFKKSNFEKDENGQYSWVYPRDVWDIPSVGSATSERIGYPTQKPELLLEKIIEASSNENDVVADFFCGGGTTPAVARKLNRRWVASDISRIAVEITRGRILKSFKSKTGEQHSLTVTPNIIMHSWGVYDIFKLSLLSDEEFKNFIIKAYGARKTRDSVISGTKRGYPVWVGDKNPDTFVNKDDVLNFAEYLSTYSANKKRGVMVAWQFSEGAKKAQQMLADLGAGVDFVSIDMISIGSDEFKEHVVEKNQEYENFLRFIMPPQVRLRITRKEIGIYEFDFSESISLNNGNIINVQADFNFDGAFSPTTGYYFSHRKRDGNALIISFKFEEFGKRKVAFKVEDDQGGETLTVKELEVR